MLGGDVSYQRWLWSRGGRSYRGQKTIDVQTMHPNTPIFVTEPNSEHKVMFLSCGDSPCQHPTLFCHEVGMVTNNVCTKIQHPTWHHDSMTCAHGTQKACKSGAVLNRDTHVVLTVNSTKQGGGAQMSSA